MKYSSLIITVDMPYCYGSRKEELLSRGQLTLLLTNGPLFMQRLCKFTFHMISADDM